MNRVVQTAVACLFLVGCLSVEPINDVTMNGDSGNCSPLCVDEETGLARVCGDDGCGGTCGNCPEHFSCVAETGRCGLQALCGDGLCQEGEDCESCGSDCACGCGQKCVAQLCKFTACDNKVCGSDGCGQQCGECPETHQCVEGTCKPIPVCGDGEINGSETCDTCVQDFCGDSETVVCWKGECCEPDCGDTECGSDGCGGDCGSCPVSIPYCQDGQCVEVCIPDCRDKECGTSCDTLCGDFNGECPGANEICQANECVCEFVSCAEEPDTECCDEGQTCFDNYCCTPQVCSELGYECGTNVPDGCGGVIETCGTCPIHHSCTDGYCAYVPSCGNGTCDLNEDCASCSQDCSCAPLTEECLQTTSGHGICAPAMVEIPAGDFWMGCNVCEGSEVNDTSCEVDEHPYHRVHLDAYEIDRAEVTNDQYAMFLNSVGTNVCSGVPCVNDTQSAALTHEAAGWVVQYGKGNYPVVWVNWFGAQEYCQWTGRDLCTEAQWEKAARGGCEFSADELACEALGRTYPWGNEPPNCSLVIMVGSGGEPSGCGNSGTSEVCSRSPAGDSLYGLCDMAGNVYEWTLDAYFRDYYCNGPDSTGQSLCENCGTPFGGTAAWMNPLATGSVSSHATRGGGYHSTQSYLTVSNRNYVAAVSSNYYTGIRCCRTP